MQTNSTPAAFSSGIFGAMSSASGVPTAACATSSAVNSSPASAASAATSSRFSTEFFSSLL